MLLVEVKEDVQVECSRDTMEEEETLRGCRQ